MKRLPVFAVTAIVALAFTGSVFAKDCECDQHDAGASGSGSCTLAESSSYCSITYTGTSSSSRAASNGFNLDAMNDMSRNRYQSSLPLTETFRTLNNLHFAKFDERLFRDIVVNTIILSATSGSEADTLLNSLDFDDRNDGLPKNDPVQELFYEFTETGCAEANIGSDLRYLIIHIRSEFNGRCDQ